MGFTLQVGALVKNRFYPTIEAALKDDFKSFAYNASINIAMNALNI